MRLSRRDARNVVENVHVENAVRKGRHGVAPHGVGATTPRAAHPESTEQRVTQ
jgi:hypothetical protein